MPRLMMSLINSCSGDEHPGVFARQRLGQVIVVVGQTAVDPVLGAGFGGRADPVDQHAQGLCAGQPGRSRRATACVDSDMILSISAQQQLILGGEVLVEGAQRGLRPFHDLEHREVGAPGLAEYRQRRFHEAAGAGFGVDAARSGDRPVGFAMGYLPARRYAAGNDVTGFVEARLLFRRHDDRLSARRRGPFRDCSTCSTCNRGSQTASPQRRAPPVRTNARWWKALRCSRRR